MLAADELCFNEGRLDCGAGGLTFYSLRPAQLFVKQGWRMERVAIVGGTHGNELGGIYLHRLWQQLPLEDYPFRLETWLGNPGAIAAGRRYLDQDLNRSFVAADLANAELAAYEAQRAKVLAQALAGVDFLFDLHNTTAHMGLALILSRAGALEDPLTRQLCAHLRHHADVRVYVNPDAPADSPYLPAVARRDITVEVGPMAHGTLDAGLFFRTRALIEDALHYLTAWVRGEAEVSTGSLTVYSQLRNVDYPRTDEGLLAGMIHPRLQGRDFQPLAPGEPMFVDFSGDTIVYDGAETVWPVFINEQAYYEKRFAMSLTRRLEIPL